MGIQRLYKTQQSGQDPRSKIENRSKALRRGSDVKQKYVSACSHHLQNLFYFLLVYAIFDPPWCAMFGTSYVFGGVTRLLLDLRGAILLLHLSKSVG